MRCDAGTCDLGEAVKSLTPSDVDALLKRFHGFHDARYLGIELIPPGDEKERFACLISLLAEDHANHAVARVVFRIDGLEEFQIRYNDLFDYPNVRDDIAIKTFDGKVYFDLGFSASDPQSPGDIRRSDIYFVGTTVSFDEFAESP